jgi:hypothetical protein
VERWRGESPGRTIVLSYSSVVSSSSRSLGGQGSDPKLLNADVGEDPEAAKDSNDAEYSVDGMDSDFKLSCGNPGVGSTQKHLARGARCEKPSCRLRGAPIRRIAWFKSIAERERVVEEIAPRDWAWCRYAGQVRVSPGIQMISR